ncbi:MAG: hypothetical protein Q8M16_13675, partial [Pirellulaceae bacterium]|nr:hypothetical protein [Pirellulaceae bacterium]
EADLHLRKALKLSSTQEKSLRHLHQRYRDAFTILLARSGRIGTASESQVQDCERWLDGWRNEWEQILSESQAKTFRTAYDRFLIRSFGLQTVLQNDWLRKKISLESQQVAKLNEVIAEQQKHLASIHESKWTLIKSEVTAVLNAEQMQLFDELCGVFFEEFKPPLELVIYQNQLHESDNDRLKGIRDDPVSVLLFPRYFRLLPSGVLLSSPTNWQGTGGARLKFLGDLAVNGRLELSESQRIELDEITLWFREELSRLRKDELDRLYKRKDRTNLSLDEIKRDTEQYHAATKRFETEFLEPFDKAVSEKLDVLLIPQQQRQFEDVVLNHELRALGLSNALVYGNLGKRLHVSPPQRERVEKIRDKLTELLSTELRDFENELFAKLGQELDPQQLESWKSFIGFPLADTPPAPSFLFMSGELIGSAMSYRR